MHSGNVAQDILLSKLINATNGITGNLNKVTKEFNDQSRREEYERRRMLNFLTNLDTIRETITRAESTLQNLMTNISIITIGKLPLHLLPPNVLVEGLEAVGNTLLTPTTSGVLWNYYHLTMVKSIVTNDGIRLFIELSIIVYPNLRLMYSILFLFQQKSPVHKILQL